MTFEETSDILRRLLGIEVSPDSVEKISEMVGEHICSLEEEKADILSEKPELMLQASASTEIPDRVYIEADGAMINTREGKWRENKLGMAFSESDIVKEGSGEDERIRIKKKRFISCIGNPKENLARFRNLLKILVCESGALLAKEVVIIADGAQWIYNSFCKLVPKAVFVLDWFHVTGHLWSCAHALFGEGSEKAEQWVEKYKELIWKGKIKQVLELLLSEAENSKKQTPLRELYAYFDARKDQMRYDLFRKRGYYIGSGAIESANKYVIQQRLKQSGMRWTYRGANAIAALRRKYLSMEWDSIWPNLHLAAA